MLVCNTASIYIITKELFLPAFSIPRETSPPLADLLLGLLQRNQKDRMDFGQCSLSVLACDECIAYDAYNIYPFPAFMKPRHCFRNSVTLFLPEATGPILIHGMHFISSIRHRISETLPQHLKSLYLANEQLLRRVLYWRQNCMTGKADRLVHLYFYTNSKCEFCAYFLWFHVARHSFKKALEHEITFCR